MGKPVYIEDVDLCLRWCFYSVVTEEYDRTLPHRMERGEAMVRPDFVRASNSHAITWRRRLRLDINTDEGRAAQRSVMERTHEGHREILDARWTDGWERLPSRNPEQQPTPRRML